VELSANSFLRVIHVEVRGLRATPDVRFTTNSDRRRAAMQNGATGQCRHRCTKVSQQSDVQKKKNAPKPMAAKAIPSNFPTKIGSETLRISCRRAAVSA
jgi:hypothetical protein